MLNDVAIMGRLTRDPELRKTSSGISVASFTLAVERDYTSQNSSERETDFIDCVAWRQTGEFVSKYFQKGAMAVIRGKIQTRNWTDKDGNKRRSVEIRAETVYFGSSKKSTGNASSEHSNTPQDDMNSSGGYPVDDGYPIDGFEGLDDIDPDMPF